MPVGNTETEATGMRGAGSYSGQVTLPTPLAAGKGVVEIFVSSSPNPTQAKVYDSLHRSRKTGWVDKLFGLIVADLFYGMPHRQIIWPTARRQS